MKKNLSFILFVFYMMLFPYLNVDALEVNQTGYINKKGVLFYSEPNYQGTKVLNTLDTGDQIKLLSTNLVASTDKSRCSSGFYHVSFYWESNNKKTYTGYVCSDFIQIDIDTSKYAAEFAAAGIPESYYEKLTLLKDQHPNWKFTAYKTGLNWSDVVAAESIVGISYIQITDIATGAKYISLDEGSYDPITKTYIVREGSNWYAANAETVAYYLDPRNFLNEIEIFMFENLGYNSTYQTLEVVQKILSNTDLYGYASDYIEAATYNGNSISPVSLSARSRQEVVKGDGTLSGSANGTVKINNTSYYNVYNLGAFSSCSDPVYCAIEFASGYNGTKTSYNRPWKTIKDSILNGATYIGDGYINQKQNTLYFQKWNVTNNVYGNYSNQYMTNIKAATSEASSTYNAYANIEGLLDSTIEFIIPVYENMPNKTSLPTTVDESKKNELEEEAKKEEEKEQSKVVDIINNAGYKYNDSYLSGITIGTTAQAFISNIKGVSKTANVTITTTDESGNAKTITDGTVLKTNDIITVQSGEDKKSFRVVIYGDVNGDGKISAVDYVKVMNYMMSSGNLSGSYKLAADINNDGKISAVDYVKIMNYIMNK